MDGRCGTNRRAQVAAAGGPPGAGRLFGSNGGSDAASCNGADFRARPRHASAAASPAKSARSVFRALRARGPCYRGVESSPHLYALRYRGELPANGVCRRPAAEGPVPVDKAIGNASQIPAVRSRGIHRGGGRERRKSAVTCCTGPREFRRAGHRVSRQRRWPEGRIADLERKVGQQALEIGPASSLLYETRRRRPGCSTSGRQTANSEAALRNPWIHQVPSQNGFSAPSNLREKPQIYPQSVDI
jgi:hypothetical protein